MPDLSKDEIKQLEELNKSLATVSGLTQDELRARIQGMTMRQVVDDAIQYGRMGAHDTKNGPARA